MDARTGPADVTGTDATHRATHPASGPHRRRNLLVAAGVLVVFGVLAFVTWFAPEGSTQAMQDVQEATQGATPITTGVWQGDAGHRVSGAVTLYVADDPAGSRAFLIFTDYRQTAGPDVYLYLASDAGGDYGAGTVWKLLVPGGAGDGRSTLEGDFQVPIPADVPLDQVASAIVWCDDFSVPFGHATFV